MRKAYVVWVTVIKRTLNLKKEKNTMDKRWLNFSIFSQWYDKWYPNEEELKEIQSIGYLNTALIFNNNAGDKLSHFSPKSVMFLPKVIDRVLYNPVVENVSGYKGVHANKNQWKVTLTKPNSEILVKSGIPTAEEGAILYREYVRLEYNNILDKLAKTKYYNRISHNGKDTLMELITKKLNEEIL